MTRAGAVTTESIVDRVACPRCGQPQRGLIHAEAESWPLHSDCSECGLSIDWAEYFRSQFDLPRGWFEHCSRLRLPLAAVMTTLASLVGWPLWTRLRMAHPIRSRRLVALCVLAFVVLPMVGLVGMCVETARRMSYSGGAGYALAGQARIGRNAPPVVFLVHTTAGDQVHAGTLAKPSLWQWVSGFSVLVSDPLGTGAITIDGTATVSPSPKPYLNEAIIELNPGGVLTADGSGRIPTQWSIPAYVTGWTGRSPRDLWSGWLGGCRYGVLVGFIVLITSVATFIVLPIARRRAKVRWAHIGRAAVYALLGPFLVTTVVATSMGAMPLTQVSRLHFLGVRPSVIAVTFLATLFWWRLAVGQYLRMERPWAVSASIAAIATLTSFAATLVEL
ncbi:MAG: hypothetical protein JNL80_05430 [Phycisphaerae bacterium]|jgi:hypothetical protein|nr:hypothetical protein [Phycisphaerae bacterium]